MGGEGGGTAPRPWRKMTVAVWRPAGGRTMSGMGPGPGGNGKGTRTLFLLRGKTQNKIVESPNRTRTLKFVAISCVKFACDAKQPSSSTDSVSYAVASPTRLRS